MFMVTGLGFDHTFGVAILRPSPSISGKEFKAGFVRLVDKRYAILAWQQ
jgi:hypothetical protein